MEKLKRRVSDFSLLNNHFAIENEEVDFGKIIENPDFLENLSQFQSKDCVKLSNAKKMKEKLKHQVSVGKKLLQKFKKFL